MIQLYDLITSHDIKPIIEKDLEFRGIDYTSYIVEWSMKSKIHVMVRVLTNSDKFFVVGVNTRLDKEVVDRKEAFKLANDSYRLVNNSINELRKLEFMIDQNNGFILYNNTPIVLLRDNGVWRLRVYSEFEEHANSYMLFYDNYAEFLKEILKGDWNKHLEWRISEDQALSIAIDNSPFKNLNNITHNIHKYIAILDNGLYPVYRVRLTYKDQYYEAYINTYDGKILNSSEGIVVGINDNNRNVIQNTTPLWIYLGIILVLIPILILIGRRITRRK